MAKLSNSHTEGPTDLVKAGINSAPTGGVGGPHAGTGFTPARNDCQNLLIAHIGQSLVFEQGILFMIWQLNNL